MSLKTFVGLLAATACVPAQANQSWEYLQQMAQVQEAPDLPAPTKLEVKAATAGPSSRQVETAMKILKEALEARKKGDEATYQAKLAKAIRFLQRSRPRPSGSDEPRLPSNLTTQAALKIILEAAEVANGDKGLYRFDVRKFNLDKEVKKLEENLEEGSCSYETEPDTQANLNALLKGEYTPFESDQATQLLEKLHKEGAILAILSRVYGDGESESCGNYYYRIYARDGWRLELDFSFTD